MRTTKKDTMLKIIIAVTLMLVFSLPPIKAQENIGNLSKQLMDFVNKDNYTALQSELESLSQSNNEDVVSLAIRFYRNYLELPDKASQLEAVLTNRFPKGIFARKKGFENVFNKKRNLSASQREVEYLNWLKEFPEESFSETNRKEYAEALNQLAILYSKEKNQNKVTDYLRTIKKNPASDDVVIKISGELVIKNIPIYIRTVKGVANELLAQGESSQAIAYLKEAIKIPEAIEQYPPNSTPMPILELYSIYGDALIANGQINQAIEVFAKLNSSDAYEPALLNLVKGLSDQGKNLDAFLLLQEHLISISKSKTVLQEIEPLYRKLNNQNGDFVAYEQFIDQQIKDILLESYKADMIKKEAPAFSLVNKEGKTVNLADLKGKIVVLDFWATWCGPCVASFPGMQAAVNYYKEDPDVEFLFINTFETNEDYKNLVEDLLAKSNYKFNVLFDEMKDKSKRTANAYGVKSIPAKFFIDKEGFIRFQSNGSSPDSKVVLEEMIARIEMIKKG